MKSKWESHISPYMNEIESWAQQGMPQRQIAGKLGVSYTTFRKYVKKDEKLEQMLKAGKQRAKRKVERALQEKARTRMKPAPTEIPLKAGGTKRQDQSGAHRKQFERNKKKIYATQEVCAICGKPVDFSLKYPHPLSPCIDHIIPLAKGGHPSDINNLQLAHWTCNRQKSDKLSGEGRQTEKVQEVISNRVLPHTFDWRHMAAESEK